MSDVLSDFLGDIVAIGDAPPTITVRKMRWIDTATPAKKIRNNQNSRWDIAAIVAERDPDSDDDSGRGFLTDCIWHNKRNGTWWRCEKPEPAAAVWGFMDPPTDLLVDGDPFPLKLIETRKET